MLLPLLATLPPRPPLRCRSLTMDAEQDALAYWEAYGAAWDRPLKTLDVQAAWNCGELDGILPSGRLSRASKERLLTLGRALELFESDQLQVRRRFRNLKVPEELAPRWERVVARRTAMQADGRWDAVLNEGERYRQNVIREQASPLGVSRAVAGALIGSPVSAERGAFAALLATAGIDAEERWLTAALLADFEAEVNGLEAAPRPARLSTSFAEREAERDLEEARSFGVTGVLAGLLFGALTNWYIVGYLGGGEGGGGGADGLEKALDLLQ
eukprot:Transcript_18546.p1 GENE.Transcript_18546~~Transcript_18546.p1  ORF type:complete len:272 (-),score=86.99 Transcript_18546:164-979(-)